MMRELEDEIIDGSCWKAFAYSLYTCSHGTLPAVAMNLCKTNPLICNEIHTSLLCKAW